MSWFPYPKTNHGVPILSREDIDSIGEHTANIQYPHEVDIELIAEKSGYIMDFQSLSHNGCYLGMAVFLSTDYIPVYDEEHHCADFYHADKGTILIEKNLICQNMNRYRFTVGHELGHQELHQDYFQWLQYQNCKEAQGVLCRSTWRKPKREERTDIDWIEYHANAFAAATLMPRCAFIELVRCYDSLQDNPVPCIDEASKVFGVSPHAVCLRLNELKLSNYSYDTYCLSRYGVATQ